MNQAIITAADASYFPGVQLLWESIKGERNCWHGDVNCFDLGLTREQTDWMAGKIARRVIDPSSGISGMPQRVRGWQTWNKPFYFFHLPPGQYLWLDADCFVVGRVSEVLECVFEYVAEAPLILQHWARGRYLNPNSPELYRRFPVRSLFTPFQSVHANLVGFELPRDAELLSLWCYMVSVCAEDASVRRLVSWFDEGALHWAVQAAGRTGILVDRPEWDQTYTPSESTRKALLENLAEAPPGIIHFAYLKPWEIWRALSL